MDIQITTFSQGKNDVRNEDKFGYSKRSFVLSDGATDKTGLEINGKSGGELLAKLIVDESLNTDLNGKELVMYLTGKAVETYKKLIPEAILDGSKRPSATLVCARVTNNKVYITQVGDTSFRVNGKDLYTNNKTVDELNAKKRSDYIKKTGNVGGGRDHIMPNLKNQYIHQNNLESDLGYGCIDGTAVPDKFIKIFEFPLVNIETVELISDGYFSIPEEITVEAYEEEYKKVEQQDPDKYLKYLSTKSSDDRTVVIIRFR